jgi:hypothetical protein
MSLAEFIKSRMVGVKLDPPPQKKKRQRKPTSEEMLADLQIQATKRTDPHHSGHLCSFCTRQADKRFEGDNLINVDGEKIWLHWCASCAHEWRDVRVACM